MITMTHGEMSERETWQERSLNGIGYLTKYPCTCKHNDMRDEWLEPLREFKKQEVKNQLRFKYMELFFIRGFNEIGDVHDPHMTDRDNLEKAIKELKWEENVKHVYVNRAVMAINGMFQNGEYIGEY